MENVESVTINPLSPVADIKSFTEASINLPIKKDSKRAFFQTEGDLATIDNRRTVLNEYNIRKEFVYLKLFKLMGLNVPNCELTQDSGKTKLAVEDLGPGLQINRITPEDKSLYTQLKLIDLCSLALGINPESAEKTALSNKNLIVFKVLENNLFFLNDIELNRAISSATEHNPEIVDGALLSITKLDAQSVLETVTESGLNDTESHEIIKNVLRNRNRLIDILNGKKGVKTEVMEDKSWINLDKAILESRGNDKFKWQESTVKELSQFLKLQRDSLDAIIPKKILGIIASKVDDKKYSIFSDFYSRMTYSIPILNSDIIESLNLDSGTIDRCVTPTKDQLQTLTSFEEDMRNFASLQISEVPSFIQKFHTTLDQLSKHRKEFVNFSQIRSRSLVSHLSTYSGIKMALKSNLLESSLKQQEKGKEPFVNSPAGKRELLPQLTFAVNGADTGYGGVENDWLGVSLNNELSAGFIGLYSDVVRGNKFYEYDIRNYLYDGELHVFNSEHAKYKEKGIEIPIDKFILLVPEKSKQDWISYLQKPESTGGCGKNEEWVRSHLKDYPSKLTIDLYIKYFATPESLGFAPKLGTLVTDNEKLPYHQGQVATAFRWVDA